VQAPAASSVCLFGPLLGGLLTHYELGSIFLINAPVVVIAVIGI
jgi:hypothetical protein